MARLLAIVALFVFAAVTPAATPEKIDEAIRRGVAELYGRQKDDHWESSPTRPAEMKNTDSPAGQWGGSTALAVYALICAGEDSRADKLAPAIAFLRKADIVGTYAIGMRAQLWNRLPRSDENKAAVLRDANFLLRSTIRSGPDKGFYGEQLGATKANLAASEYGVIGMWAAAELLAEIPETYWRDAETAWTQRQQPGGGWALFGAPSGTFKINPTITAAGVATLFAIQENLYANAGLDCRGNATNSGLTAIDKAMAYLVEGFPALTGGAVDEAHQNPTAYEKRPAYALYNIERIAAAAGARYLGPHDWYKAGSEFLIEKQRSNGGWGTTAETSFALIFLASGRTPVMMNKLRYASTGEKAPPANWNQRPRDAANAARWVSRQTERDLGWQLVDLAKTSAIELGEAPIAYLAGNTKLALGSVEKAKLKAFVEAGGMIVANADCNAKPFVASVRELAAELFPQYELRPLPSSHLILAGEQFITKAADRNRVEVLGLSNGIRELLILIPTADAGRQWQRRDVAKKESFELIANLYLYAVEKTNVLARGMSTVVNPDATVAPARSVHVGRLKYIGNWDPEPGAWRRMSALLRNRDKIEAIVDVVDVAAADVPPDVKLLHWTGTAATTLAPAGRRRVKDFVDRGGTLLVDAAGGNAAFADGIEKELREIFGDAALTQLADALPTDHPLYGTSGPEIAYRTFARAKLNLDSNAPRLRGIAVGKRLAVIVSSEDLTTGLTGCGVDGVIGYTPAAATALVRAIVLSLPK